MDALESHLLRQIEHSREFFWHRLRWRAISSHLPRRSPFSVIDVGAGAGLLGMYLERDFPSAKYLFIEPISSLERHLERLYGPAANASGLHSFAPDSHVALLDVLEHQLDDRTFLRELVDRMAVGTSLLITVPALPGLWSQWDVDLGHHRRYDKASLRAALTGLPVHIDELSYIFPEMVPVALLRRWRRAASSKPATDPESSQFPDLPGPLNAFLFHLGSVTQRMRRWWPFGSSLLAVVTRT